MKWKITNLHRVLSLAIPLLLLGCSKWGAPKKSVRPVPLYADTGITSDGIIPSGTVCRIDESVTGSKVYGFHKIECQNGQSGYLIIGDGDEIAFEAID